MDLEALYNWLTPALIMLSIVILLIIVRAINKTVNNNFSKKKLDEQKKDVSLTQKEYEQIILSIQRLEHQNKLLKHIIISQKSVIKKSRVLHTHMPINTAEEKLIDFTHELKLYHAGI